MDRHSRLDRVAKSGFREISASLRERIKEGYLEAGTYLPTERELQVDFGASRTTIRKALAALIESGWAQNIPNRGVVATRGLKPGSSRNVAFLNTGSTVSQILLTHLCLLLEERGLNLVAIGGRHDYPMEASLQRAIENEHLGAIVWPNVGFPDVDKMVGISRRLPIVAIDHPIPGIETDLVTFDHEKAAFEATEQLIRQGAKRIGVTGMLDMLDITHDRFKGYMRALFANGLQPNPGDFLFTHTSGSEEPNTKLLEYALKSPDRPDALFALNDMSLPSVIAAANRAGLSLPRDLKMSAIGADIDLCVGDRGMTAIAFDWAAMAEQAVELLVHRVENLNLRPQKVVVSHRLRVRGLCGAPPSEWYDDGVSGSAQVAELAIPRFHYLFKSRWSADSTSNILEAEKSI